MKEFKKTIKKEVNLRGVGLHSGEISTITFKPAGKDEGIIFIRTDIEGHPEIPADIDHVIFPSVQLSATKKLLLLLLNTFLLLSRD